MFHRQWLFETDQVQVLGVAARFAAPLPIENTTNPEWRGVTNFFCGGRVAIVLILARKPSRGLSVSIRQRP